MLPDVNLEYYLGFSFCLGIGPITFQKLFDHFGSAESAYCASEKKLSHILHPKVLDSFISFRREFKPENKLSELYSQGITVLYRDSVQYPTQLKHIPDPPICIYLKGNKKALCFQSKPEGDFLIGIVGTRTPTPYGQRVTKALSIDLSRAGVVVVSGMALGIDSIAHTAVLEGGGKTIAVLGCGVDIPYPVSNTFLYQRIIKQNGIVLSEFPPGKIVGKGLFVARNRIISALSHGVCIVEGSRQSGSLITARYAAEQGKDVFAVPGPITNAMSEAPHYLLKQGAKLVTSATEILEEYHISSTLKNKKKLVELQDPDQRTVVIALSGEPRTVNELVILLKKPVASILKTLTLLELQDVIERTSEGAYHVKDT